MKFQYDIQSPADIQDFFSYDAVRLKNALNQVLTDEDARIARLVQSKQCSVESGATPFRRHVSNLSTFASLLQTFYMAHPDEVMRHTAHEGLVKLQQFSIDKISNNRSIYEVIQACDEAIDHEALSAEDCYFLSETLKDFKKNGLHLSDAAQEKIRMLKKQLGELELAFESHINQDVSSISVAEEELAGVGESFIASLSKDESGYRSVTVDYPTYFHVMENCKVAQTRKRLWQAFVTRA